MNKDIFLNKIYLKQERYMEALDLVKDAMEHNPQNGDLYYNYAQIFKCQGDIEKYYNALKITVTNNATLTYPFEVVQKELKTVGASLRQDEEKE